jgi:hypothetical protein
MNRYRETAKMGVPPGNHRVLVSLPGRYVAGPAPEDARKDGHIIRTRCAPLSPASGFPVSSRSLRSAQSRKRVPSFVVAARYS